MSFPFKSWTARLITDLTVPSSMSAVDPMGGLSSVRLQVGCLLMDECRIFNATAEGRPSLLVMGKGPCRRTGRMQKRNRRAPGYPSVRLRTPSCTVKESVQRLLLWCIHGAPGWWKRHLRTRETRPTMYRYRHLKLKPCVLHFCGNTLCCSLEHIRWGTPLWNRLDALRQM